LRSWRCDQLAAATDAESANPSVPRSCSSVVNRDLPPVATFPRRFSFGTLTSVKKISLNSGCPVI